MTAPDELGPGTDVSVDPEQVAAAPDVPHESEPTEDGIVDATAGEGGSG